MVPCYNEEERLAPAEYWRYLENLGLTIIFVNDGSTDQTHQRCNSLGLLDATIIELTSNQGKANALRHGILFALKISNSDSSISIIDADGAFNKEEVVQIIELADSKFREQFQSLFTSRVKLAGRAINRNTLRHIIGRSISAFFAIAGQKLPYDTQSGLKVFKGTSDLELILQEPFRTRWFMEIEIIIRMLKSDFTFKIWEEPLLFWNETKGSKVISFRSVGIFFQVFSLAFQMRRSKNHK